MKDFQLRAAVKSSMLAQYISDGDTRVFDEFALRHGAARIDLAVVNGIIHGFELKSDRDTLKRLPHQASFFSSVLDRITLVVGRRYLDQSMKLVPEWWGIELAEFDSEGVIRFTGIRTASDNPSLDILAVCKLLWRDEALSLLKDFGEAQRFFRKPRAKIYARLAEVAQLDMVRATVRHQLKHRPNWRLDALRK